MRNCRTAELRLCSASQGGHPPISCPDERPHVGSGTFSYQLGLRGARRQNAARRLRQPSSVARGCSVDRSGQRAGECSTRKSTFAQAGLHIDRMRLNGGKRPKKGELRFSLSVSFVFDDGEIMLDPDQEMQGAVRKVFNLFGWQVRLLV